MKRMALLLSTVVGTAGLVGLPRDGAAALMLVSHNPASHDRFYVGDDKSFIGEGLDFSGVGNVTASASEGSLGRWAVMISPTYFLSAAHYAPRPGDRVTFVEGNDPAGPSHSYAVDDWGLTIATDRHTSDLWLGRLTEPIPQSVAYYPIPHSQDPADYLGAEIHVYGQSNRLGRNQIDRIEEVPLYSSAGTSNAIVMFYDFSAEGVGDDEAHLQAGDSGGPSFLVIGGQLALVGIHYFSLAGYPGVLPPSSADSFVPPYIDPFHLYVPGGVTDPLAVPEPSGLLLFAAGLAVPLALAWRRRHRSRRIAQI